MATGFLPVINVRFVSSFPQVVFVNAKLSVAGVAALHAFGERPPQLSLQNNPVNELVSTFDPQLTVASTSGGGGP